MGQTQVLHGLEFELFEQDCLVIVGPNGAGKTILLRALLGLVPYEGEVLWRADVKCALVPQRLPQLRDMPLSVEDFFSLKHIQKSQAAQLLEAVGIDPGQFLQKQLSDLSMGMLQRCLIAWANAHAPQVLLLDEPMSALDKSAQTAVQNFLRVNNPECTLVMVTHDLSMIYAEATKVLCINQEQFFFGPPQALDPAQLSKMYGSDIKVLEHRHAH